MYQSEFKRPATIGRRYVGALVALIVVAILFGISLGQVVHLATPTPLTYANVATTEVAVGGFIFRSGLWVVSVVIWLANVMAVAILVRSVSRIIGEHRAARARKAELAATIAAHQAGYSAHVLAVLSDERTSAASVLALTHR